MTTSVPASAATEEDLSRVTFHDETLGDSERDLLHGGVAAAWDVLAPLASEADLTSFPSAHIWGVTSREEAARVSGISIRRWRNIGGYARSGQAFILFQGQVNDPYARLDLVAHEATHLVQLAVSGGKGGSQCIQEGAADWYGWKAKSTQVSYLDFHDLIDDFKSLNSEDRIEVAGVVDKELAETLRETHTPNPLPAFSELTTEQQFRSAHQERGGQIYTLCLHAFDLLMETGGGEDAYFEYLSRLRSTGWRQAFNASFAGSLDVFEERFAHYRQSWFTEMRLPREIEHDEFMERLLDCDALTPRSGWVCVR